MPRRWAVVAGSVAVPLVLAVAAVMLPLFVLTAAGATATGPVLCGGGGTGQTVAGQRLDAEQMGHAQTIVTVTAAMRLPAYAATVALATAYQESKFRNSAVHTDHDSEGLFQQRVSIYPHTVAIDPVRATRAFLTRLRRVPHWRSIPLTDAAQAVQHSARPDAYAHWRPLAASLTGILWPAAAAANATPGPTRGVPSPTTLPVLVPAVACAGRGGAIPPTGAHGNNVAGSTRIPAGLVIDGSAAGQTAVRFALAQLGKPYVFGAAGPDAYDCSGLMLAAWARAGVALPHSAHLQALRGTPVPADLSLAVGGDLVFIAGADGTAAAPGHVGMVLGRARGRVYLIQAPQDDIPVEITDASEWAGQIVAVRHLG
jgi:cell wall-associated NlpC family hydrolase